MDCHECRVLVELAGEQLLELEFFEIAQERIVFGTDFGDGAGLMPRGLLGGKFLEDFKIRSARFEDQKGLDFAAQFGNLFDVALGGFLVVPEIRRCHSTLNFGEAPGESGKVKETSA